MLTYDICAYIHMFFTHIDRQTHIYMYAMVSSNQNTTSVISWIKLKFTFSFVSGSVYQSTINSQICSVWWKQPICFIISYCLNNSLDEKEK